MRMSSEKKKKRRNAINLLKSRIGRDVLLPVMDSFLLEMADDGVLTVKGCNKVLTCRDDNVALMTDLFTLTVRGKGLLIETFSETLTSVKGVIESITFDR